MSSNQSQQTTASQEGAAVKTNKTRRVLRWIGYGIAIAVLVFLLVIFIALCVDKYRNKSPIPSAFGFAALTVETGSMSGTINEGDVIIIQRQEEYHIGDVITFLPDGDTIPTTHRIIGIDGDRYLTKGDYNNAADGQYITHDKVYGKVQLVIPKLGLFVSWVKEQGWIYIIAAVLVVALGVFLIKHFFPKQSKR